MYKANHAQQRSMFDNRQQMKLNSTNPKYFYLNFSSSKKIWFIFTL